ncbi:hypothetical protein II906_02070, partial [bacterium]|nr:hypothetical protein [bacterium]
MRINSINNYNKRQNFKGLPEAAEGAVKTVKELAQAAIEEAPKKGPNIIERGLIHFDYGHLQNGNFQKLMQKFCQSNRFFTHLMVADSI